MKKIVVERNMLPIKEVYKIGKVIGLGNLGEVRMAKKIDNGAVRCIKIFSKKMCSKQHIQRIYYEINLMKTFEHPNIVKIYEWFEDN
jgi:calcium-dependent protein kinase